MQKYRVQVDVRLSTGETLYNPLTLSESCQIELESLSDAAEILVKLHEFFESLKGRKAR